MAQEIEKATSKPPAKSLNLGLSSMISLDDLSDAQAAELQRQHAEGIIKIHLKAAEANVDIGALAKTLGSLNDEAAKATVANVAYTATHRQKSSIGDTEIVIGNTQRAAAGKLSMSASGLTDNIPVIIGIAAAAIILIVFLVTKH